jgi:hypothetical protein
VRVRDHGAKKLIARVKKGSPQLKVGILGDQAAAAHKDADGATVGEVGEAHEFGLGNVPERSFIRAYVDENKARLAEMTRRAGVAVAQGKLTAEQAMNLIGFQVVGEIQQRMARGIAPALSANYLPRKLAKYPGATLPLIASGQLRSAITHVTVPAGKGARP